MSHRYFLYVHFPFHFLECFLFHFFFLLHIADDDGVVVVPASMALEVAKAAQARENNETEKRALLASGVLGLDMYKMRDKLAQAGLQYLDD